MPLDRGYRKNREVEKSGGRTNGKSGKEINSRTHEGAEIGPQSLHGLRTIAVGIAFLCALFLPSVLLLCTFSVSSLSFSCFLFSFFLLILSPSLFLVRGITLLRNAVSIVTAPVAFSGRCFFRVLYKNMRVKGY